MASGWLVRLKSGLSKTSSTLGIGIATLFTRAKLDAAMLQELEELLIATDMGAAAAQGIVQRFGSQRFGKEISEHEVREALAAEIAALLEPVARPLVIPPDKRPYVMLVVGVNGNGKTTTIGKLAMQLKEQGHRVMLAAADTFRAAAVEQLKVWGERTGCEVIAGDAGGDPASVAFRALEKAKESAVDVLLIDSAGRLQNKANLMEELKKLSRVLGKVDSTAPHQVIQVLDATTGQNALSQVELFSEAVKVTGLIVTKLDGTAKGGVVVALAQRFGLPVHALGVGEGIEDLHPFTARDFARSLVGLDS